VRRAFEVTDADAVVFTEAAHRSVFYQPTGDGRGTARAGRVREATRENSPSIGSGPSESLL
jgi:hypothetical protein